VDAYSGETQKHTLRRFLASWDTLGNMAITGETKSKAPPLALIPFVTYLPALRAAENPK
jgi:hypothetical protein